MVETFKARAQLESALRDRKIAISLKRLIDGDPKQETVKNSALIGRPIRDDFLNLRQIEKYVADGLSKVNNTFHRNKILEKLATKFSLKNEFWRKNFEAHIFHGSRKVI